MKFGWLSDIHLDATDAATRAAFMHTLATSDVDAWLIGGDIDNAPYLAESLRAMEAALPHPIYFVLGNHDYYGGSFSGVRDQVRSVVRESRRLTWLTDAESVAVGSSVTVVGDDGWADARFGDPRGSAIELTDFYVIHELSDLTPEQRIAALNQLGDDAATRLAPKLHRAAANNSHVVLLTHVPPFREATWWMGQVSTDKWLPWFSCKVMGDVIMRCASEHPACDFLVLCGHTHGAGNYSAASNVRVMTAGAEYEHPEIQAILSLENGRWSTVRYRS